MARASRAASTRVVAAPAARLRSHQAVTCASDRKKFRLCQSEALARAAGSRSPTHTIASSMPPAPSGLTATSTGAPQW